MLSKSFKKLFKAVTSFVLAGTMAVPNGISVFAETTGDQGTSTVSIPVSITTEGESGPDALTVRLSSGDELANTVLTKDSGYTGSLTVNAEDLLDEEHNPKELTVSADSIEGYTVETTQNPVVTVASTTALSADVEETAVTVDDQLNIEGYNLVVGVNEEGATIMTDVEMSEADQAAIAGYVSAATGITSVRAFLSELKLDEYSTAYLGTYEYLTNYEVTASEAQIKVTALQAEEQNEESVQPVEDEETVVPEEEAPRTFSLRSPSTYKQPEETQSKKIEVNADIYYLKTPTSDPASNNVDQWGKKLDVAKIDIKDITWINNKNCFSGLNGGDISNRVISWHDKSTGPTYTVKKDTESEHWQAIFNAYKDSVSASLGVTITESDVKAIILHPYKISKNETYHIDCTVEIVCPKVVTAKYWLVGAGDSDYKFAEAHNYKVVTGATTSPTGNYPVSKIVNGKMYVFSGWYTNRNLTGEAVNFESGYPIGSEELNFYAKYEAVAPITITAKSASKPYDGTPLTAGYEYTGTLVPGDELTVTVSGSQTDVGSSDNVVTSYQITRNGTDVTSEYVFNASVNGTLTVTPIDGVVVTIQENSKEVTFNGSEQKVEGYTVKSISNELYKATDFTFTGEAVAKGTSVGSYPMEVKASDFTNNNGNFTNVSFEIEDGGLTIVKTDAEVVVTITGNTATYTYDGTEHTVTGYEVTGISSDLYKEADFAFTGAATVSGTSAGTYEMGLKAEDFTNLNGNFSKVTFNVTDGSLKITPKSIIPDPEAEEGKKIVVNNPENSVYNGENHQNKPVVKDQATDETLVEGVDYTLTYPEDIKNVGTVTVVVNGIGNYEGQFTVAYQITKAPVTVKTPDATKVYDGTALTAEGTVTGIVEGETYTFTTTGKQTEVGYSSNKYTLTWGTANPNNYSVTDELGTLTVTPKSIIPDEDRTKIVVEDPADSTYDGKKHANKPVVTDPETKQTLVEGTDYELRYPEDVTNAGEKTVTVVGKGNYEGTFEVSYVINPAEVTVTTPDATKVYDGTALTAEGTITGIVDGETYTFTTTGTQTAVGSSENTYSLNWNGTAKESNYTVSATTGTLTVTKKSIIPDADGNKIVVKDPEDSTYDGEKHANKPVVRDAETGKELVEGEDYELRYPEDVTNAGEKTVTVVGKGNYEGEFKVTYEILKAQITVTTPNAEKVYDGNALTAAGTITGFVNGETATFTTTGSRINVGTAPNTFTITWNGTASESNYTVSATVGTLKVTPKAINPEDPGTEETKRIDVEDPSDSTYDGEKHENKPVIRDPETGKELEEGKDYELTYPEDITNAGEKTVIVTGKGNYDGTFEVTYEILKAAVKVTTPDAEKVYDGTELTAEGTVEGIVGKETYTFKTTGTQTEAGSSANTYELVWDGTAVESNYTVTESVGTLTVTPKAIDPEDQDTDEDKRIVVENPSDSTYDGEEHPNKPVIRDPETGKELEEGKDYELTYPEDVTNAGEKTVIVTGKGNYEGEFEVTFEILPREITVTVNDSNKVEGRRDPEFTAELSEELIEGNEISYEIEREAGEEAGTYAIHAIGEKLQGNYSVTYIDGTLTINARPETPVTNDEPKNEAPTNTGRPETPNTSDPTDLALYGGFTLISLIAALGILFFRRREAE